MREWFVGGGIVERGGEVLLVQNRRRDGSSDWTPPGGVIDEGEDVVDAITREVAEETGLVVGEWEGPVYHVTVEAPDLGWVMRVEVWRALDTAGEIALEDPDGIVVDARFVSRDHCVKHLLEAALWVREPLSDWLQERWSLPRRYSYTLHGADRRSAVVSRL